MADEPRVLRLGALRLPTGPPNVHRHNPQRVRLRILTPYGARVSVGPTNCRKHTATSKVGGLTSAERPDVTVGDVLIGGPRVGLVASVTAILTAVSVTVISGCGSGGSPVPGAEQSVITSTTKIAGAGVLGNQRRPDEACAPDAAAGDAGPPDREVRHAAGTSTVRADPQRIVVLSGDQLDALCALGLQSRIVAAALPDG